MGRYSSDEERFPKKRKKSRRSLSRSPTRSKHKAPRRSRRRSRSRSRHSSRKRSPSESRSRSRGRRAARSRSRSYERRRRRSYSRSSSAERGRSSSRSGTGADNFKSFADMTPAEQNQARMQLALEKARAAGEAIRHRHGVESDSPEDLRKRQDDIKRIESDGFTQQSFSSNQTNNSKNSNKAKDPEFAFGTSLDFVKNPITATAIVPDEDTLLHTRFYEDPAARRARWLDYLEKTRSELTTTNA